MRLGKVVIAAALALVLAAAPARALDSTVEDNARLQLYNVFAFCTNVSQNTALTAKARKRLARAAALFLSANHFAEAGNYPKVLARARSALAQVQSAIYADFQVASQLGLQRQLVLQRLSELVQCAITQVQAGHPDQAAAAQAFYDQAPGDTADGDYADAVKRYIKAWKKIAKYVTP